MNDIRILAAAFAAIASCAGLIGYAVGVGSWGGKVDQVLVEHARRLDEQGQQIRKLEETAQNSQISLARIEEQLRTLVSAAVGRRGEAAPNEPAERAG